MQTSYAAAALLFVAGLVTAADTVSFTAKPSVRREGDQARVRFGVSAATDVEVAILNASNRVVRHLAAGLLGKNAPEPLQKDALAQDLAWDGKDDAGRPLPGFGGAAAGDAATYTVRVRLGVRPRLDRYLGRNDNTLSGEISGLTFSPQGEMFVLLTDCYRGRAELRVLDRDGKYLRTIMPYAANTPETNTALVGEVRIEGQRQPLVFNGQGHCFYPLVAGIRGQTMAWHPDGYLIAMGSLGDMCNHGPPRHLIAFDPQGGAPAKTGFVGPQTRAAQGFMGGSGEGYAIGMDRLAVSPDGQWIYLSQDFIRGHFEPGERNHGIYRVKWTDKTIGTPWLGKKEAGSGDDEFKDPQGIALDKAGQLYICDRGNNRVKVYAPDGKLLGQFPVPEPEQIAVHPETGEIYLMCRKGIYTYELMRNGEPISSRLLKLAPWKGSAPQELARVEFQNKKRAAERIALDATAKPARLWVVIYVGFGAPTPLVPFTDAGNAFTEGQPIGEPGGLHFPQFLAADPDRKRVIVREFAGEHAVFDVETGKRSTLRLPGSDLTLDQDGNIYLMGGYGQNALLRFTPDGKPLPFAASTNASNKLTYLYRAYGPNMGLRGHCIAPNGDLYVRRSPGHAEISTVDVWSPDGTLKKAGLVSGAGSGDSGIGVDNRGNVYLGMNLKPANEPIPPDFAPFVPAENWGYYRKGKRQPPWSYLYANPYLFHMGAIFKFGPQGGQIYGNFSGKPADPALALTNAPADAVPYKSGYLNWNVKMVGAQWRYPGIGIIPHSFDGFTGDDGCECLQSLLDADPYGRVYAPSAFYSSIEMVDAAGNRIARIGAYGNADSAGPGSRVPNPEIALAWPSRCDYAEADGKLYIADSVNRRVVIVRFDAAASETCALR
jgi:hypothetical protein